MSKRTAIGTGLVREVMDVSRAQAQSGPVATGAGDVYRLLADDMRGAQQEAFVALLLDTKLRVTGTVLVSLGTLDASIVHPRDVFREAVKRSAGAIILAHNHPSGDPEPSTEDLAVTRRLADAGRILGIAILDHVIIGASGYVSLAQRGLMGGGFGSVVAA